MIVETDERTLEEQGFEDGAPITPVKSSEDPDAYQPMAPGSVAHDPDEELELPDPASRIGRAHFSGMTEGEAAKVWRDETVCFTCLSAPVCRISNGIQDTMTTISRCLAYIPTKG